MQRRGGTGHFVLTILARATEGRAAPMVMDREAAVMLDSTSTCGAAGGVGRLWCEAVCCVRVEVCARPWSGVDGEVAVMPDMRAVGMRPGGMGACEHALR